jgi:CRISPR system Cascade subunit CasC
MTFHSTGVLAMTRFVQLHLLTHYPPANLNRDDTGRPKTALVGDAPRLRISSQSQKRAWRTSDVFESSLAGHLGTRTKRLGADIDEALRQKNVAEKAAKEWTQSIVRQFGALETKEGKDLEIKQLAHFSPEELEAIWQLVDACAERNSAPTEEELKLLRKPRKAVDIAMFGRMLADSPAFNVDAAIQVSHAITVHKATAEDDYFSAVDDLNKGLKDLGAGHIGEHGYGAGLFYLYICIDHNLLLKNLGGDAGLTRKALEAFIHAITKVSPIGMQNSFASRAYAAYVLAEKGEQQPRSLAQAFLTPVRPSEEKGMFDRAVTALTRRVENLDKVYGACADARYIMDAENGQGSLLELIDFVQKSQKPQE